MPLKNCEMCGSEFQARLSVVRTCSVGCRNKLISSERKQRHITTKACVICGAGFTLGGRDWKRKTCSKECQYKLTASKTSTSVACNCETCGKEFFVPPSRLESGGGLYCSKGCVWGRNKANTERPCVHCGKMFTSPPSHMHVKTCSTECGYAYFGGERKPNFKGMTRTVVGENGEKRVVASRWYAAEKSTFRRLAKTTRKPSWADDDQIAAIYEMAAELESRTGIKHHVDHIVPLKSRLVCGLHVQDNLQALPVQENLKKGNRHWPDMP